MVEGAMRSYLAPIAVLLIALGMVFSRGFASIVLWAFAAVIFCGIVMALSKQSGV